MSSDRAKHWAWKQVELDAYQLLLVLAMADNCGEELICYARLSTLAGMARQSERTVQRNLESLVELGKVAIVAKRPGRTTLFRLLVPLDFGNAVPSGPTPDSVTGVGQKQGLEASNGAGSGGTPDNVTGVPEPLTGSRGPPTGSQGTHDSLSYDSSLNPSLHKPSQTRGARAGPAESPARASTRESPQQRSDRERKRRAFLLENSCRVLGISGRQAAESLDDVDNRVAAAQIRKLEEQRRQRAEAEAATAPEEAPA
ncbi:MAG: hypothetical protein ABI640_13080 [Gammaproteobacteria bacterium]